MEMSSICMRAGSRRRGAAWNADKAVRRVSAGVRDIWGARGGSARGMVPAAVRSPSRGTGSVVGGIAGGSAVGSASISSDW